MPFLRSNNVRLAVSTLLLPEIFILYAPPSHRHQQASKARLVNLRFENIEGDELLIAWTQEWRTVSSVGCRDGIKSEQANSVGPPSNQVHLERLFLVGSAGGIQWADVIRYHRSSRIYSTAAPAPAASGLTRVGHLRFKTI